MSDSIEDKNIIYSINDVRFSNTINFPNEIYQKLWSEFDWKKAESELFFWQQRLSKVALKKDYDSIKKIQIKITSSLEARALAVRKVSELSKNSVGIDGVKWKKTKIK